MPRDLRYLLRVAVLAIGSLSVAAIGLFGLLAPGQAAAAAAVPALAPEVRDAVLAIVNDPEAFTPHVKVIPKKAVHAVDVNQDGVADWWIDFDAFGFSAWCGTGGCKQMLFVSRPDGHFRVEIDQQTREFNLSPSPQGARLDIEVHGSACGGSGNVECRFAYIWDAARERWSERAASNGSTVLSGGGFAIGRDETGEAPLQVQAAIARDVALCQALGASNVDGSPSASSIPDVNGDGIRDWLIGGLPCQDVPDTITTPLAITRLFVSDAGGFSEGWMAPIIDGETQGFEIDIATAPAILRTVERGPMCDFGQPICPRQAFHWDSDLKRLQPDNKAQPALDASGFAK
jgi:hypothetical protein